MIQNLKIVELKSVIAEIKKQNRLKIIGVFLIPFIIGLFLIKKANLKKKEVTKLKDNLIAEIEEEIKSWITELSVVQDSITFTFLSNDERVKLLEKCDAYLDHLRFIKSNKFFFTSEFNDFINQSFETTRLFKEKNFIIFNQNQFVNNQIVEYEYIIRNADKQDNEFSMLRNSILAEINIGIIYNVTELKDAYNKITDTFLTYHKKRKLVKNCDSFLTYFHFLRLNKLFFTIEFNHFINQSFETMMLLRKKIEEYDNSQFIEEEIIKYDYLFRKSPFPLDKSQKISVITDDTHNLVVAGAGSGKTEVLITRIAYLLERKQDKIESERILVLAFQNKAAKEIQKRLYERFGYKVEIKTFHSCGFEILKRANTNLSIDAPKVLEHADKFIKLIFDETEKDMQFQNDIINYMKVYGDNVRNKTKSDFEEKKEYYQYMRNLTYTALDGTKVKSEAEREIMNFFIMHDLNGKRIKIIYENPAEWMMYTNEKGESQVPKPDFFFPEYDIYIEHWAVDKNGNVPEWFEGEKPSEEYNRGMQLKKEAFLENTKYLLVDTFYWEFKGEDFIQILENKMLCALRNKYPEEEFKFTIVSYNNLIGRVWKECTESIKILPKNISNFITISKTYNISPSEIEKRIYSETWSPKQREFSRIAIRIYKAYESKLFSEHKIDYSDMINLAIKELKRTSNLYENKFDHILIDEYQDISTQRYELIKSLIDKNKECKLFCVGDDWQSIMGFSGSNLDFFVDFQKYFEHPSITYLAVNYRSCKSVVDTGAEIIKHNSKAQLKKETIAENTKILPLKVYLSEHDLTDQYYDQIIEHCTHEIEEYLRKGYKPEDLMILSRIANSPQIKKRLLYYSKEKRIRISVEDKSFNAVPFMSVHKSKGLQARVVFLLNMVEGLYGFPCEIENPDIFEPAIKGRRNEKEEEERRLFYVAVTRAKEQVVIYSKKGSESKFLNEIKDHVIISSIS